jgi:phosphatidate cytidylyltransferase
MAINVEVLKTRALTAVVFVAVMLVGLLWNQWSFIMLFTIIHFGCWYEFVKLMKKIYGEKYLMYCLFGLVYITLPILLIIDLFFFDRIFYGSIRGNSSNEIPYSVTIPLAIVIAIWINDTMAYLVGSLIGKTPFSKISPKKTWEGTIGGIIIGSIATGVFEFLFNAWAYLDWPFYKWFFIALIAAIFGTAGDLLESKLKRMADVKDSGALMPGHGGFLDRFDSLLVAVPFVWLYVKFFI